MVIIFKNTEFKNQILGPERDGQQLRVLDVFAEDLGWVFSPHMVTYKTFCNSSSRTFIALSGSSFYCMHVVPIHTCRLTLIAK